MRKTIIVILGPTASGKSELAVTLARRFGGEIISADSRQLYRGMDLGTGKITPNEMRGVPHHLLDVASPKRRWTVANYETRTTKTIKTIQGPVWLVGGSPFYIEAVLYPGRLPAVAPNPKLRRALKKLSVKKLFARLQRLDPVRASTIEHQNPVRLIRAIEIATKLGSVPTRPNRPSPYRILKIGIRVPSAELDRRIHNRLRRRMRAGMRREVRRLHNHGLSWKALEAFGLEYRFLAEHLQGLKTLSEATIQLERSIRDFSRRQMMWWKRDSEIHWINTPAEAATIVRKFLR